MYKQKWILNLKVGDRVFYNSGRHYLQPVAKTVEKVYPSGIVIVDGVTFNPDGQKRASGNAYHTPWISEWTQEKAMQIECENADKKNIAFLKELDIKNLTAEQRKNITAYIKEIIGWEEI